MDTRKITLIATIAAIALVAVGVGYAYTATTTNSDNTVVNEYATIQLKDNSGTQAYTTTTNINIEYNTKTVYENSQTAYKYDVAANEDLTAVKKITLEAFNNETNDVSKNLTSLVVTLNTGVFSANGYNASTNFIATLTGTVNSTAHTWVGAWSSDDTHTIFTFTKSNEGVANDQIFLVAGPEGSAIEYTLTLQLKSTTGYPYSVPVPAGTYTIDFLATVGM